MRTFSRVSARLFAAIFAFATVAPAVLAQDQTTFGQFTVPFAFETVSGQHFQPGVYKISLTGMHSMILRSPTSSGVVMISQEAAEWKVVAQGKAEFTHYGDRYYLRSITRSGSATHLLFGRSKAEREAQIASVTRSNTVELALLQTGR